MTGGALSEVLLRFASQFVGRFRGGLGHTNILDASRSSPASAARRSPTPPGPGAIMIRMMRKDGYHAEYAAALTAAVSILGPIIPPSISDDHLCARVSGHQPRRADDRRRRAGHRHRHRDGGDQPRRSRCAATTAAWSRTLHARATIVRNTWRALPALVLPVLILGGIASGAFTPTEASVVAVFYALVAGRWIYRSLEWRMLPAILSRSALMTASVLIIVAMSAAFAWVLTVSRVPQELTELDRRHAPVAARVPVRRERAAARVRHLHRAAAGHRRAGADPRADRARARHQRPAVRHHRHRQPDDGDDHAAGGRPAVRDRRSSRGCR